MAGGELGQGCPASSERATSTRDECMCSLQSCGRRRASPGWTGEGVCPYAGLTDAGRRRYCLAENWCLIVDGFLRCTASPVGYLFQAFSAGVFEESYFVTSVFEFMDIGPYFGLP